MDVTAERSFAELLRVARQRAEMTQRQLADRASISLRAVSDLERGINRAPRAATLTRLADALALSTEERRDWATVCEQVTSDGRSPETPATSTPQLPRPITSFIGRDDEIRTVIELLERMDVRLVTLTGPGGVGKTRLALAIVENVASAFPDGFHTVNLAPLTDPSLVVPTVAQTLGVRVVGVQTVQEAVATWLRHRTVLIVLDNVEHLLPAAPEIATLLDLSPGLTILATSRAPLHVSAEREIQVPPLAVPAFGRMIRATDLAGASAVRLFIERAQAVRSTFCLTDENATTIASICTQLDGLPLAIELAAARLRLLSPSDLLARLTHSLPLLVDGPRDAPKRQRTLFDTIAWSYHLLAEPEQRLFRQLTIFAGGWTLESASAVCDSDIDVLAGMSALIDHSLVRVVAQPGGTYRFVMLATIREYGSALAVQHGEADRLSWRLANHIPKMIERAKSGLEESRPVDWIVNNRSEIDNVRASLRFTLDRQDITLALQIATVTLDMWLVLALLQEYREWLQQALALADNVAIDVRASAYTALGGCAHAMNDHATAEYALRAAIPLHEELGSRVGLIWSVHWLGWTMMTQGRSEIAADLFAEALKLARSTDNDWLLADVLIGRALILTFSERWQEAVTLCEESLALVRSLNEQSAISHGLHVLGFLWLWQGNIELAEQCGREALSGAHPDDLPVLSNIHELLATVALGRADLCEAGTLFRAALRLTNTEEDPLQLLECLEGLATVAVGLRDPVRAATLLGAIDAIRERKSLPLLHPYQPGHNQTVDSIQTTLSATEIASAWDVGRQLSSHEAAGFGLEPDIRQTSGSQALNHGGLSGRETDVLSLIVDGFSDREIAARLFISRHTVAHHVSSLLGKLGVSSRTAAATYAVREHMV